MWLIFYLAALSSVMYNWTLYINSKLILLDNKDLSNNQNFIFVLERNEKKKEKKTHILHYFLSVEGPN